MPTHAILVTWKNMDVANFVGRAEKKYGAHFHRLYFDDGAALGEQLREVVAKEVGNDNPLKIYICGHGGAGLDHIRDNDQTRVKTLGELAELLRDGLQDRSTSMDESNRTRVDMISCLFGRSPDGLANTSSAAKLHQALINKGVFVDLVARTETVTTTEDGRKTLTPYQHYLKTEKVRIFQRKFP